LVRPGGHIFIGDVRNLRLLKALQTSIHLHQAAAGERISDLKRSIEKSVADEEELVIDPGFFHAIRNVAPALDQANIRLKRGRFNNELTRYRYDVVLQVKGGGSGGSQPSPLDKGKHLDWRLDGIAISKLAELLAEAPSQLHIAGVPNARVLSGVRAVALLAEAEGTARDLRDRLEEEDQAGVDPEDIWTLAGKCGYDANIYLPAEGDPDSFNVTFAPRGGQCDLPVLERPAVKPIAEYANNPLRKSLADQLGSRLRESLAAKLPDYMLPSSFVVMNSLPLAPNGKVDRRALPAPDALRLDHARNFQSCRTATEEKLAKIWSDALGGQRVGINDSFFDLGGHSLMVAQVVSRVRDAFSIELPLAAVFERPTVADLGECVDAILRAQSRVPVTDGLDDEIGEI